MAVNYKIVKTATPGVKGGGAYRYYPRVCSRRKMDLIELSKRISKMCTLHAADVNAVLTILTTELPDLLLDNYTIQLGEFGTFSLHASGEPSDSPEDVNESKITGLKVAFRPGKAIKDELKSAHFVKVG
ncbi:HU family DNA-binding protein [Mariniphaga sp.]|uniref:HU family DNA-binding protein n=1 Tax=Mariniphaga sp. TaxID=1954475 RepID=UPI00356334FD